MERVLDVEELNICYGKKLAVKDMSFCVGQGEIAAIVGESGSGKTTLLRAVCGMLPEGGKMLSGAVRLSGKDTRNFTEAQWRAVRGSEIGVIFQNPGQSLSPLMRVKDQFVECIRAHGKISKKEALGLARDMLDGMKFDDVERVLRAYPFELSGGMCQRVAIGFAAINRPRILLADEPTSALDVAAQRQVVETLLETRRRTSMSMLMVTHNIGIAFHMADYIGVMYKGELLEWGRTEELLRAPREDYTRRLLDAVPKLPYA